MSTIAEQQALYDYFNWLQLGGQGARPALASDSQEGKTTREWNPLQEEYQDVYHPYTSADLSGLSPTSNTADILRALQQSGDASGVLNPMPGFLAARNLSGYDGDKYNHTAAEITASMKSAYGPVLEALGYQGDMPVGIAGTPIDVAAIYDELNKKGMSNVPIETVMQFASNGQNHLRPTDTAEALKRGETYQEAYDRYKQEYYEPDYGLALVLGVMGAAVFAPGLFGAGAGAGAGTGAGAAGTELGGAGFDAALGGGQLGAYEVGGLGSGTFDAGLGQAGALGSGTFDASSVLAGGAPTVGQGTVLTAADVAGAFAPGAAGTGALAQGLGGAATGLGGAVLGDGTAAAGITAAELAPGAISAATGGVPGVTPIVGAEPAAGVVGANNAANAATIGNAALPAAGAAGLGSVLSTAAGAAGPLSSLNSLLSGGNAGGLAGLIPALMALNGSGDGQVVRGYQGGIPSLKSNRTVNQAAFNTNPGRTPGSAGQNYFSPLTYTNKDQIQMAAGGPVPLEHGGFVFPADVVSHAGNGNSEAGAALLEQLGAQYMPGPTDGMADELDTTINGEEPAKLSHGEMYMRPEDVARIGGGDAKKGTKTLQQMMASIRKARTGTDKQGKEIDPSKYIPQAQGYAEGGTTAATTPAGSTTTSTLSDWAGPYVTDMLGRGQALSQEQYPVYQGQLTAGPSALQNQAFQTAGNLQTPAAFGQAANTAQTAVNGLTNNGYAAATFGNNFTAPGAYQATSFQNGFQQPGQYNAASFGNQFQAPSSYQAGDFTNTFQGTGAYDPTQFANNFAAPGAYQATQFSNGYQSPQGYDPANVSNTFSAPQGYTSTQFSSQYQAPQDYAAGTFTNSFAAPQSYTGAQIGTDKFDMTAAQQYMNPYLQMSLDPQIENAQRNAQLQQIQNDAKMTQAGAFGGSRQALMNTETQRNLGDLLSGIVGTGYNTAYNNAQGQFNADQSRALTAAQATEQSRQFGAGQNLSAAQLMAQYGLSAQQAAEASRQFGAAQSANSAQQAAQFGQNAAQATEASRQFGATQGMTAAQLMAQYGMTAQQANQAAQLSAAQLRSTNADTAAKYGLQTQQAQEAANQFGSTQGLTAADMAAKYGLSTQQAQEAANQFGSQNALSQAQLMAQYGMTAQQAAEASRQFASQQGLTSAQLGAQYGLAGQNATEASRQFGAQQGLTAADMAAKYGLQTQQAQEGANQFGAQNALTSAQLGAQYGLAGQQATESSRQFGAQQGLQSLQSLLSAAGLQNQIGQNQNATGLANLQAQLTAGGTQRDITQAGLTADQAQFDAQAQAPYKQLQFQQSLLSGLPVSTYQNQAQQLTGAQQTQAGLAGLLAAYPALSQLFGGGTSLPGTNTGETIITNT